MVLTNLLIIMLNVWSSVRSTLRRRRATDYWHSLLTDPRSAALLYHSDENVVALQQKLRDFGQNNTSYASSILFFMSRICTVEDNEMLFSHIRTVLEIFILYSIETSDLNWVSDERAFHLSQQIETLSSVGFRRLPPIIDRPSSMRHCLRASVHLKVLSRVEQCRAEVIQALVGLSETMCLEIPLSMYNPRDPRHQQNSANFRKRLRRIGFHWISMAYCLAVEQGGALDAD